VVATEEIEGLVLCRVGDHQIAFPAAAVGSIDLWEPGGLPAAHARAAFGLQPKAGKLLLRGGFSLVVDALEIVADRAKLLPVPAMLLGAVGGSLRGFVQAAGALVPLLGLAEFSTFVTRSRSDSATEADAKRLREAQAVVAEARPGRSH
jgi:hypothetical protein